MRSWLNHLAKPDRYLHKAAKLVVRDCHLDACGITRVKLYN